MQKYMEMILITIIVIVNCVSSKHYYKYTKFSFIMEYIACLITPPTF